MDPYDVQYAPGVPAEDSTMGSPAEQPQMKEEPKSNRVRWRYEIPPRDPALPPRTRKPKAEIFIDYSTRRSSKDGGKDTETKRRKNRKTRRKVTESSGNVAELSHDHHTRPEDEDESTEPPVDGISSDGPRFRDFVPELMESRTRSAGLNSSGNAPQPLPPARRLRAPKRKQAAQGRGAKRNAQDQVEEDPDGAPTPAPGAVVARLGGPEGIVLIPRDENMGPVSANENRPIEPSIGGNAENGQDAPNNDQNDQEPAPPQRNRNQEEDSHDVELTDAPYDGQNAQYDPRLDFEQHLQHENQVMEQTVEEDGAQHAQDPAPPVQVAENQVAGNKQKQPSRAFRYRDPHLEEETEEDDEFVGTEIGNQAVGNQLFAQFLEPGTGNEQREQPSGAVTHALGVVGQQTQGEVLLMEQPPHVQAPAPPPQQNWNQVVRLQEPAPLRFSGSVVHPVQAVENQAPGVVAGNENLSLDQQLGAGALALGFETQHQQDNQLADRIQALPPPPPQNWNPAMDGAEDVNVDLKPTDLAYAVGRQPNADIKVEVEEHGLFDMDHLALGNVVGEVGEVDEEDVVLEDVPPRNMDDDDEIIVVLDGHVSADRKLTDAQLQDPKRAVPGELRTDPDEIVKFNAPFEISQAFNIKLWNKSNRRIAFKLITDSNLLEFHPPFGIVEGQGGRIFVKIETKVFKFRQGFSDRILIEWMNGPRHGDVEPNYFMEGGMKNSKPLTVEYSR
ncbi:hypothetical protein GCK72_008497 [Caenorhabditis remanei]|uniref:MSP domain-containing protein n=1 Tax=Caenorhabditis remanei TaxID=31234 RepID=A0A6A5GZW4_CAERE|nr:hypothetical protein GCK72_008497 [Caenorhabditis remanei]KAF1760251.1 hypothetical protein GCK72_008497 [Caenorhabditis remanei]